MSKAELDQLAIMGRVRYLADGAVAMGFPGIEVRARFSGSELRASFRASSADCWIDVVIDGETQTLNLAHGTSTIQLKAKVGSHKLSILRRNESWQGVMDLVSLETDGEFQEAPELPGRKLMFIGDSITCGAGVDNEQPGYPSSAICSNAGGSFGMLLGRRLDAQVHLVSYGGRGLIRDYRGVRDANQAPQFYTRVLPDDERYLWNCQSYQPDAIVVCLGTNDFSTGIPDQVEWVSAMATFVADLRRRYPAARIVLATSPIFPGDPEVRDYLHRLVHLRYLQEAASQDGMTTVVDLSHQPGTPKDGHPTGAQHVSIADELETVLRPMLGWM